MPNTDKPTQKTKPQRNPFAVFSVYLHAVLIYFVATNVEYLIPNAVTHSQQEQATAYTRESYKQAMQSRIDDMAHIKKTLDALANQQQTPAAFEQTSQSNASIEALYNESETLLNDIQQINQAYLEEKLKHITAHNPLQSEANRKNAQPDTAPDKIPESTPAPSPSPPPTPEEMVQQTASNQREARKILERVQKSEKVKAEGVRLSGSRNEGPGGENSGQGTGAFDAYNPANPLAVEAHFSDLSRGNKRDLTSDMRDHYRFFSEASTGETASEESSSPEYLNANTRRDKNFHYSRKLSSSGVPAKWVVLDSWYFIGPYPNKNRSNLHTRFAPEISVDLNAMYIGDRGRLLTWQHIEYDHLPIIPPDFTDFAIYYAYAEVLSDEEQNVWLNIGSDDQSRLWINGIPVWQSSNAEKVWATTEGKRRVRLKKGRNRFLFRLENGIQRAAFSVVISKG